MNKKNSFRLPEGIEIPEGIKPGDSLEFMAEFKVEQNGEVCLVGVEGTKLPGYSEKSNGENGEEVVEETEEQPMPGEQFAARYQQALESA